MRSFASLRMTKEVADVPGWREYEFPELKAARR
jgi:hypothetical protein